MSNRLSKWNPLAPNGNPTKYVEVKELIKRVKKKEVSKQKQTKSGQTTSWARWVRSIGPYNHTMYMVPTACKFQYLMVAKVEDTANLKEEDLKPNPEFPFAFLYQMCWWKNVVEESNAPGQTLVSSNLQALLHSSTSWHFIGSVVSLCTLHW